MTKIKPSGSSIVVPSTLLIHLVNSPQFLNVTCVVGDAVAVISPFTM